MEKRNYKLNCKVQSKEEKSGEFKKMFKLKLDMASEIAKRFRSGEIALD